MSDEELRKILEEYSKKYDLSKISESMGISNYSLKRMLNPNAPFNLPVIRLVSFIEAADKDFALLDHIEAELGRVVSKIDSNGFPCDISSFCSFSKEYSDVIKAFSDSLQDNKIDQQEASKCIAELNDLLQVIMGIIQSLTMIEKSRK